MPARTSPKAVSDEQLRSQHAALLQAISERGLTHEEALEFRRLKAKVAAAEEGHRRQRLEAKRGRW